MSAQTIANIADAIFAIGAAIGITSIVITHYQHKAAWRQLRRDLETLKKDSVS